MRPFAYSPKSIEGRNAERGGKVTVRAAARGGLAQLPSHFLCKFACGGEPGGHFRAALHGWTIDAAADLQLTTAIVRLQAAELFFNDRGVSHRLDAYIHFRFGFGCNYVAARAAANDAGIHRQSAF